MYEHRLEPLLPRRQFLARLARHGGIAFGIMLFSLAVGTAGFHWFACKSWLDAFLNASMLLGGMGPVGEFTNPAGKIFASLYALYAGIVFIGAAAIFLTPVVHRVLHKLHLETKR